MSRTKQCIIVHKINILVKNIENNIGNIKGESLTLNNAATLPSGFSIQYPPQTLNALLWILPEGLQKSFHLYALQAFWDTLWNTGNIVFRIVLEVNNCVMLCVLKKKDTHWNSLCSYHNANLLAFFSCPVRINRRQNKISIS